MAYNALLASIPDDQVMDFRKGKRSLLEASSSILCSHALTYWVEAPELRNLLCQAMDGGQVLRPDLWHPLGNPVWHPTAEVSDIESRLRQVWSEVLTTQGLNDPKDWYVVEISKVLQIFGHALLSNNGVVSFLEPPFDRERAERVAIPLLVQASAVRWTT